MGARFQQGSRICVSPEFPQRCDPAGSFEMRNAGRSGEDGFLLLGAIVAVFLLLLVLSIAAPTVAKQLRREREVESAHRADQYVRAIRLFYRKNGNHYPGSIEQLEKTNNIRFLRQQYVDPLTGKADWRLIHFGEQKTTVKGFFGQPLAGLATSGLGSSGSSTSPAGSTGSASLFGASGSSGGAGTGGSGAGTSGAAAPGTSPSGGSILGGGSSSAGSSTSGTGGAGSSGLSSQSATSFTGSGAPFVGIGSSAAGNSIVVVNEQITYPTWEFIYDPRIEQLKAKSNLLGGGVASGGSGLGSGSSPNPNTTPGSTTPTTGTSSGTSAQPPQ